MSHSRYQKLVQIGHGAYGAVYKALDTTDGSIVAVKEVYIAERDQGLPSNALREISLLQSLDHPHIVPLRSVEHTDHSLSLVFQYHEQDLLQYLQCHSPLSGRTVCRLLREVLEALLFCHTHSVLHRDLKPQNVLVDSKGRVKLADFGLARVFTLPIRNYSREVMTLWYRAPEIMLGSTHYSTPIDIWSAGCLFAELVSSTPLFPGDSEIDQLFRIFRVLGTPTEASYPGVTGLKDFKNTFPHWSGGTLEQQVPRLSPLGLDLLSRMLTINPTQRLTAREALHHPFFSPA